MTIKIPSIRQIFFCSTILLSSATLSKAQSSGPLVDLDKAMDYLVGNGFTPKNWDLEGPLMKLRKIVVSGKIHEDVTDELVSKLLYLDSLDSEKPIDLYLRTNGGWMDDAFSIIDIMTEIEAPVNVHAMGVCQSSGVLILLGATGERTAGKNSKIAPHFDQFPKDEFSGRSINHLRFARLYQEKAKLPENWVDPGDQSDKTYFLGAEEALKFGVIDRIRGVEDAKSE